MTNAMREQEHQALVDRLMSACGGSYSPEVRRKFFIGGPQWAAPYQGQALLHAPTRQPVPPDPVIERLAEIGIAWWATHDSDIVPTKDLGTERQDDILSEISGALQKHGVKCSMVTGNTFFDPVWAASPASEQPEVRACARERLENVVEIAHKLGAQFIVY